MGGGGGGSERSLYFPDAVPPHKARLPEREERTRSSGSSHAETPMVNGSSSAAASQGSASANATAVNGGRHAGAPPDGVASDGGDSPFGGAPATVGSSGSASSHASVQSSALGTASLQASSRTSTTTSLTPLTTIESPGACPTTPQVGNPSPYSGQHGVDGKGYGKQSNARVLTNGSTTMQTAAPPPEYGASAQDQLDRPQVNSDSSGAASSTVADTRTQRHIKLGLVRISLQGPPWAWRRRWCAV